MSQGKKIELSKMLGVAEHIVSTLASFCERIEIAGSLRRQRPYIGDIEIVALPKRPYNLFGEPSDGPTGLDTFLEGRVSFVKNGKLYKQFEYGRYTVDLFLPESAEHWGCVYLIRTGSHKFNMWLMSKQQKVAGVKFEDGRLLDWHGLLLDTREEEDVFKHLNLPFIPVTMRDDNKWIDYLKEKTYDRKDT